MPHRPCCRSCRHCLPPEGGQQGWCQLRQLTIHPDLVSDLWCHHWTARPPRLPDVAPTAAAPTAASANHQLSLAAMLQES